MQFLIPLTQRREPLFRQVYVGMRQAILSGKLRADERLPSTRDLAEQLGISRTVVLLAYDQLLAEGFVIGRAGSGTYVATQLGNKHTPTEKSSAAVRLSRFGSRAATAWSWMNFPQRRG